MPDSFLTSPIRDARDARWLINFNRSRSTRSIWCLRLLIGSAFEWPDFELRLDAMPGLAPRENAKASAIPGRRSLYKRDLQHCQGMHSLGSTFLRASLVAQTEKAPS